MHHIYKPIPCNKAELEKSHQMTSRTKEAHVRLGTARHDPAASQNTKEKIMHMRTQSAGETKEKYLRGHQSDCKEGRQPENRVENHM